MGKTYQCHKISEGVAEGEMIFSNDDVNFYTFDPSTGMMFEKGHDIEGKSVANKIFSFPGGKASSVVQADGLYQLLMKKTQPKAIIIKYPETVLVACAIIMEVPMVDRVDPDFYNEVKDGDRVKVDATNGIIEILD